MSTVTGTWLSTDVHALSFFSFQLVASDIYYARIHARQLVTIAIHQSHVSIDPGAKKLYFRTKKNAIFRHFQLFFKDYDPETLPRCWKPYINGFVQWN